MTTSPIASVSTAMELLLLLNATAVLALTGIIWFVQVVHYPLFAEVGEDSWDAYHREHSRRTTCVVIAPMTFDLVTSIALVLERPPQVEGWLAVAGALAAVATWAVTGALAVPAHRALGAGWDASLGRRLVRVNWLRTAAWTGHATLVLAMLAQAG